MKKQLTNCDPTILLPDTLMTWDWEFMDKHEIGERCLDCEKSKICKQIVDLLSHGKTDLAKDLISNT